MGVMGLARGQLVGAAPGRGGYGRRAPGCYSPRHAAALRAYDDRARATPVSQRETGGRGGAVFMMNVNPHVKIPSPRAQNFLEDLCLTKRAS